MRRLILGDRIAVCGDLSYDCLTYVEQDTNDSYKYSNLNMCKEKHVWMLGVRKKERKRERKKEKRRGIE